MYVHEQLGTQKFIQNLNNWLHFSVRTLLCYLCMVNSNVNKQSTEIFTKFNFQRYGIQFQKKQKILTKARVITISYITADKAAE